MDRDMLSTTAAFNKLPIELNKEIVEYLSTDRDIANFRIICRATHNATDGDNFSFWRKKFRERYAMKDGTPNKKMKKEYLHRGKVLRRATGCDFFYGNERYERKALHVLKDLIVESFQGQIAYNEYGHAHCPNQNQLLRFILNSNIFLSGRRAKLPGKHESGDVNPLLIAIKLMCSHFLFNLEGAKHNVYAVDESQKAVYSPTNAAPIYGGPNLTEVNMEWTLHCLNFFRYHMMNEQAQSLFDTMNELAITQKPCAWRAPLKGGCYPLNKHWKGTYAFLEHKDLKKLRKLSDSKHEKGTADEVFADGHVEEGKIQSLELDFLEDGFVPWPKIFEERLHSLRETNPPRTRAQQRNHNPEEEKPKNIQFTGEGEDLEDHFYALGWLNPLPDQCGIPGWQRITMMKHFMDNLNHLDHDNLWAYEGVVLPGGRIILGRWWYASDEVDFNDDYNGPFILWAVDPEPELEDEEDDE